MSIPDYADVIVAVERAGFFTRFDPDCVMGKRLILASKRKPHGLTGNSFWIARRGSDWYLATWRPSYYRITDPADVLPLCLHCLRSTNRTHPDPDNDIKTRYGLTPLTAAEQDDLFPVSDARQ